MLTNQVINEQQNICEKYKADYSPVTFNLMIGISDTLKEGIMPINGERHLEEGSLTGWFIWAGEEFSESPDFFKPVHISHIEEQYSLIAKYLALPPGWRFQIDDKGYEDVWEDKEILNT